MSTGRTSYDGLHTKTLRSIEACDCRNSWHTGER